MSVTPETFQLEMLPLNKEARINIPLMSVTPERFGTSVALYSMLTAFLNAPFIVVHFMSPHCSIDWSLAAFAAGVERLMLSRSPEMATV